MFIYFLFNFSAQKSIKDLAQLEKLKQLPQLKYTLYRGTTATQNIIDRLLEAADQQASSVRVAEDFDKLLFQQFMSKSPIWDFQLLSRD